MVINKPTTSEDDNRFINTNILLFVFVDAVDTFSGFLLKDCEKSVHNGVDTL
jgi:hypothetical protein